jgi:hypothetical protein
MLSEAVRFEAGHFGGAGDDRAAGHDRHRAGRPPAEVRAARICPLVGQYAERFARYRERRVPSAEQIAGETADLLDRGSLPLRVPVGLRTERLFARLSPSLLGRLVRSPYKW